MQLRAALVLAFVASATTAQEQDKNGRAFSLFNLVQFKSVECKATANENGGSYSGLMGTCLTSTECTDRGGSKKGNCASGFGVCCVKQLLACGGTIKHNNTYVANVGYPTALTTGAVRTCTYTVNRVDGNNICQLRLDFQTVVMTTGTTGLTTTTSGSSIQAVGKSGVEPPLVSGTLSGDHMYLEVHGADPTVTVRTIASGTNEKWNIRLQQIACDSEWKAPRDCTQYILEDSGTIRSYNARHTTASSNQELTHQDLNICFRQNKGYCGVIFSVNNFDVGSTIASAGNVATGSTTPCSKSWGTSGASNNNAAVHIPGGGIFCNKIFSAKNGQTVNSPVTVKTHPVLVRHVSDHATSGHAGTGFILNYVQI